MEFCFRKLEFKTIYYMYSNEVLYKHFRGAGGIRPCLFCLFKGGPEFGKTCLCNTCTLPYGKVCVLSGSS